MRTLVVYESMYGNTHTVAEHIAAGLAGYGEVRVVPVEAADAEALAWADLLIVGGPTHAHSLSSKQSRQNAVDTAAKPDSGLHLDPDAEGPGLRDWFHDLASVSGHTSAAFDTRYDAAPVLTGRASRGIAKRLASRGYRAAVEPESFLVDKHNVLLPGEAERAEAWGATLADTLTPST
jgi:hypothetical protein